jgi:16S rRNA processing protein RimM
VNPETDFPERRFQAGAALFINRTGVVDSVTLTTVRFQGGRPVVGFSGVGGVDEARELAGLELRVPIEWLAELPEGMFYRHDLVGCTVEASSGRRVGVVTRVEGDAAGSRLVVETAQGEVLVPLALEICTSIDVPRKRIVIEPPEGLLELNADRHRHHLSGDGRAGAVRRHRGARH